MSMRMKSKGGREERWMCVNRLSEVNELVDSLVLLIISVSLVRLLLIAEPAAYCGIVLSYKLRGV